MTPTVSYDHLINTQKIQPPSIGAGRSAETAAREFESVFLTTMLKSMFTDLGESGIEGGKAEATWRGLMVEEYAKTISEAGGIGIADMVKSELLAIQEQK